MNGSPECIFHRLRIVCFAPHLLRAYQRQNIALFLLWSFHDVISRTEIKIFLLECLLETAFQTTSLGLTIVDTKRTKNSKRIVLVMALILIRMMMMWIATWTVDLMSVL